MEIKESHTHEEVRERTSHREVRTRLARASATRSGFHVIVGFSDKLRLMNLLMEELRTYKEIPIKACREVRRPRVFIRVEGALWCSISRATVVTHEKQRDRTATKAERKHSVGLHQKASKHLAGGGGPTPVWGCASRGAQDKAPRESTSKKGVVAS